MKLTNNGGIQVQVTKEILNKQLATVQKQTEGFMQGYVQALSFVNGVLDAKEETTEGTGGEPTPKA